MIASDSDQQYSGQPTPASQIVSNTVRRPKNYKLGNMKNYRRDAGDRSQQVAENVVIRIGENGHQSHQGIMHSTEQLMSPGTGAAAGYQTHLEARKGVESVERGERGVLVERQSTAAVDFLKAKQA